MIAAVPIFEDDRNGNISNKFGRSPYFAIVNQYKKHISIVKNPYFQDKYEVGKNVINLIKDKKVDTLIGFELGLKVLQNAKKNKLNLIVLNRKNITLKHITKYLFSNH